MALLVKAARQVEEVMTLMVGHETEISTEATRSSIKI